MKIKTRSLCRKKTVMRRGKCFALVQRNVCARQQLSWLPTATVPYMCISEIIENRKTRKTINTYKLCPTDEFYSYQRS